MNIKDSLEKKEKTPAVKGKSTPKTSKVEKKPVKVEESIKDVYLTEYYIKDVVLDRIIETNLSKHNSPDYNQVFYKGLKPVLEGLNNTFSKVEQELSKMKLNDEKILKLTPEDAYGVRNKELLKIIPFRVFKENNLRPVVGLTVDVGEGKYGTIRSVSGGRVMVDFNSPYADHEIEFYMKLVKKPVGEEKIKYAITGMMPGIKQKSLSYDSKTKELKISIEKGKFDEKQAQGFEQFFLGMLKNYVALESVKVTLV